MKTYYITIGIYDSYWSIADTKDFEIEALDDNEAIKKAFEIEEAMEDKNTMIDSLQDEEGNEIKVDYTKKQKQIQFTTKIYDNTLHLYINNYYILKFDISNYFGFGISYKELKKDLEGFTKEMIEEKMEDFEEEMEREEEETPSHAEALIIHNLLKRVLRNKALIYKVRATMTKDIFTTLNWEGLRYEQ